nr:MAG TPA: hypothetical protein [Caudoviricetes sp.]
MRNSPKIKIAQTALTPRAVLCCVWLFYTNYYFLNCAVYRKM